MRRRPSTEILNELAEILTSPPKNSLTLYQRQFLDAFQEKLALDISLANPRFTNVRKFVIQAVVGLGLK